MDPTVPNRRLCLSIPGRPPVTSFSPGFSKEDWRVLVTNHGLDGSEPKASPFDTKATSGHLFFTGFFQKMTGGSY
jgi:hypothetical protein